VVQAGASLAEVEVEPLVLPAGADAEVDGEPTAATDADAGAGVEVDRWGRGGTASGTSEEHCWMEQPQPSSSWFPCGRGLHRPRS
jgi:hypothetical protein